MKNRKRIILGVLLVLLATIIPSLASADEASLKPPAGVPRDPISLFNRIIVWIMGVVGILAVGMVVWGGVQIITSAGDKTKHGNGIKTITYALIGLAIVLLSYSIVAIVGNAITKGQ